MNTRKNRGKKKKISKPVMRRRITAKILNMPAKHYFGVNMLQKLNVESPWKIKRIIEKRHPLILRFKGNNPRKFLDQHKLKLKLMIPSESYDD